MLTAQGKSVLAYNLYRKGGHFIAAGVLLKREGGNRLVALHLFCQGYEIVLKAILLMRDYDRFVSQLQRPLGHDLVRIVEAARTEFHLNPLEPVLIDQLVGLNGLYKGQQLRYQSDLDLFLDPHTIPADRVFRKMVAAIRLTERELRRDPFFSQYADYAQVGGGEAGVRWGGSGSASVTVEQAHRADAAS